MQILLDWGSTITILATERQLVKGSKLYANFCARTASNDCGTVNLDERSKPSLPVNYALNLF